MRPPQKKSQGSSRMIQTMTGPNQFLLFVPCDASPLPEWYGFQLSIHCSGTTRRTSFRCKMPLHRIRSDHRRIIRAGIVQKHPCLVEIRQLHHGELETDLQSRLHQTSSCRHWSEPKNKDMRICAMILTLRSGDKFTSQDVGCSLFSSISTVLHASSKVNCCQSLSQMYGQLWHSSWNPNLWHLCRASSSFPSTWGCS